MEVQTMTEIINKMKDIEKEFEYKLKPVLHNTEERVFLGFHFNDDVIYPVKRFELFQKLETLMTIIDIEHIISNENMCVLEGRVRKVEE